MNDIKQLILDAQKQKPLQIWVPTKDKFYPFRHLTLQHYSQIAKFITTEEPLPVDKIKYLELLNTIIQDCCLASVNTNEEFTTVDRDAIILQLRIAVNDKFTLTYGENSKLVSLKEHIDFVTSIGGTQFERNITITNDNISVIVDIPSIVTDQRVNQAAATYNFESDDIITLLSFAEAVKYIKSIDLDFGKQGCTHPLFQTNEIEKDIEACNLLPVTLINKVIDYANKVQAVAAKILTYKAKIDDKEESVFIDLSPNLLISS